MTRAALWAQYVAKNPQFAGDGNVTLSANGLKKLFEQTWALGHDHGFANGKAWQAQQQPTKQTADLISIFGRHS